MGVVCFMVERVNERLLLRPACDREHAPGDPCNTNGVDSDRIFDVKRVDTGEIVERQLYWWNDARMPGSMFWREMTSSDYPSGPEDWPETTCDFDVWTTLPDEERAKYTHVHRGNEPREQSYLFADGPQLCVILPNKHLWNIDSRASNCTMPFDYAHRCWVRVGDPPKVTVAKDGLTCAAGAGSIQSGDWHGFLRDGELVA